MRVSSQRGMSHQCCEICETAPGEFSCDECGMLIYCTICCKKLHSISALEGHMLKKLAGSPQVVGTHKDERGSPDDISDRKNVDWNNLKSVVEDCVKRLQQLDILKKEISQAVRKEEIGIDTAKRTLKSEIDQMLEATKARGDSLIDDLDKKWSSRKDIWNTEIKSTETLIANVTKLKNESSVKLSAGGSGAEETHKLKMSLDGYSKEKDNSFERITSLTSNKSDISGDLQNKNYYQALSEIVMKGAIRPPGWVLLSPSSSKKSISTFVASPTQQVRSSSPPSLSFMRTRTGNVRSSSRRSMSTPMPARQPITRSFTGFSPSAAAAYETRHALRF